MLIFNTVPTTLARRVADGNGVGTVFATNYVFRDETSLVVTLISALGVETVQALTTNYTVDGGEGNTGSVIMIVPPASGETLVIERLEPYLQQTDLLGADPFAAEVVETQFDKIVMMVQQLLDTFARAILAPLDRDPSLPSLTLPEPVDGQLLLGRADLTGWDNTDPDDIVFAPGVLTVPVSVENGGTANTVAATLTKANFLATTGSAGAYVATSSPAATGLVDGMSIRIVANHTATTAMTLNLDALGAKTIFDAHGATLPNGGFQATGVYALSFSTALDGWITKGHTRPFVSKLMTTRVITTNTTWSKPSNLDYIEVEIIGGGGSSGGCALTGVREAAAAGGGGGGQFGYMRIDAASLGATETVAVGSGAPGPGAGSSSGTAGGASSFGSHITASGGSGGAGSVAATGPGNTAVLGGAGGSSGAGGTYHIVGEAGQGGITLSDESSGSVHTRRIAAVGDGGSGAGPLGGGGGKGGFDAVGAVGGNFGSGGGAPSSLASAVARAGSNGKVGVVIVREYTFEYV